jgi:hypothetical protein
MNATTDPFNGTPDAAGLNGTKPGIGPDVSSRSPTCGPVAMNDHVDGHPRSRTPALA